MKVFKELAKAVRRFAFEFTDEGHVYFPESKLLRMGVFTPKLIAPDGTIVEELPLAHNRTVMEGRNHQLDVVFHGGTPVTTWYLGVFEGNYTPLDTDTAATFPGSSTECTAYDEATRVAFVEGAPSGGIISNAGNEAVFTFNANKTIYGGFLISSSAKGATTGVLMSAARFSPSRVVEPLFSLQIGYNISLVDA